MEKRIRVEKKDTSIYINYRAIFKNISIIFLILLIVSIINTAAVGKRKFLTHPYSVQNNDTVWKIASKICDNNDQNLDVQNVIYDIKDLNNIDNWNIYVGQTIQLPIYD